MKKSVNIYLTTLFIRENIENMKTPSIFAWFEEVELEIGYRFDNDEPDVNWKGGYFMEWVAMTEDFPLGPVTFHPTEEVYDWIVEELND